MRNARKMTVSRVAPRATTGRVSHRGEGLPMASASTLDRLLTQLRRTGASGQFDDESDSELLERFRKHDDPASFEALVRRHGPLVLAACRKVLSNGADVDDAF